MVLGKRKAREQGGRELTAPEFARKIIERMHRVEVWGKLKELEFYIHLSPYTDLNRAEREAVADCLECKFAEGDFDSLQRDFMSKLTHLERTVRGRYDHVINFLQPTAAPSISELTTYALRSLDSSNVQCLKDMLILDNAYRVNKVINSVIETFRKQEPMTFEDMRNVSLDIQEFVPYLFPWQRQILRLHLLISQNKPHPAEVAWVQDALMSPGIARVLRDLMKDADSTKDSAAMQRVQSTVDHIVNETIYQQAGLMAASLRADVAELDQKEMDVLIGQIRDAQDFIKR